MHVVVAIVRRELAAAFGHPLAYAVLTLFAALVALFSLVLDDVLAGPTASMRGPFSWTAGCLVLLVPAVTMRAIAEERRSGRLEIVGTLPITPTQLVVGKWLAAVVLVGCALGLTASYPLALSRLGDLDWGPVLGGYLGLLLLGAALAAVGIAASALTDAQVVAFVVAFAVGAAPWLLGLALPLLPGPVVPLAQHLTFEHHVSTLARGVLDTRSLAYFAAVIAVGLRVAVHGLAWRRLR